jgi:hypothetical protein
LSTAAIPAIGGAISQKQQQQQQRIAELPPPATTGNQVGLERWEEYFYF